MMNADDPKDEDERAARAAASLKETEDLLAGFDRPGRTPRTPPVKRDFVDYHLEKGRSNPAARPPARVDRDRRDLPTAIIPEKRKTFPGWLPWAGVLLAMSVGGALLAASLVTPSSNRPLVPKAPPTTSGSLGPKVEATTGPERDIPLPPPSAPVATATETNVVENAAPPVPVPTNVEPAAPASARPRASGSAAPSPAPSEPVPAPAPSVTPSGDFIRHL